MKAYYATRDFQVSNSLYYMVAKGTLIFNRNIEIQPWKYSGGRFTYFITYRRTELENILECANGHLRMVDIPDGLVNDAKDLERNRETIDKNRAKITLSLKDKKDELEAQKKELEKKGRGNKRYVDVLDMRIKRLDERIKSYDERIRKLEDELNQNFMRIFENIKKPKK